MLYFRALCMGLRGAELGAEKVASAHQGEGAKRTGFFLSIGLVLFFIIYHLRVSDLLSTISLGDPQHVVT